MNTNKRNIQYEVIAFLFKYNFFVLYCSGCTFLFLLFISIMKFTNEKEEKKCKRNNKEVYRIDTTLPSNLCKICQLLTFYLNGSKDTTSSSYPSFLSFSAIPFFLILSMHKRKDEMEKSFEIKNQDFIWKSIQELIQ